LRLGHLNMIQGIIGRVAGFSAAAKNFSVTLAAAAVAVNLAEDNKGLLWIALGSALLLATIDAYYLAQEKAFRNLYDSIASRPLDKAADLRIKRPALQPLRALVSFSVWAFYMPQLIVAGTLMLYK
jgi:hypothetical protein